MSRANTTLIGRLEAWSQTLFLAGGALVVVYGALLGFHAMWGTSGSPVGGVLAGSGGALAFLGLLGLYTRFADPSPGSARVGAGAAVVGFAGFAVVAVLSASVVAGVVQPRTAEGPSVFFVLVTVGMIVGFGAFGLASYRAGERARRTTLLLFAPAVVFALVVGTGAVGLTQPWVSAVLGLAHGLSYLAVGAALRAEGPPAVGAAADSTA